MASIPVRWVIAASAAVGLCVASVLVWASLNRASASRGDPWVDAPTAVQADHAVVVAELFTSEGCSSCPPADDVLRRLVHQPLGGATVLGLGEHVDYWDRLGWRDGFSSPAFSTRQGEYQAKVFHTGSIYTPQIVIDGRFEAVGSDVVAIRAAIARATTAPKARIAVEASPEDARHLRVRVRVDAPPAVVREKADLMVAVTQDRLTTDVQRGENRGRRLTHSAVVRSLTVLGSFSVPDRTFTTTTTLAVAPEWNAAELRIVGFLQERESRRIVGAGSVRVDPQSQASKESTR